MTRQFLLHGSLVKFCLCKTKVGLTTSRACLHHPGLVNITGEILLYILHALGRSVFQPLSFCQYFDSAHTSGRQPSNQQATR